MRRLVLSLVLSPLAIAASGSLIIAQVQPAVHPADCRLTGPTADCDTLGGL